MNNKEFTNLDINLYSSKLDNGLEVYVVPKENFTNISVTLTVKYGSTYNKFKCDDKVFDMPLGIAHFLEHKMFEQEDGNDPFKIFTKQGVSANANTSYFRTIYLFDGCNMFKENLEELLDYVQSPYFTDENVLKEKGIIISEINMTSDDPYRISYQRLMFNLFKNKMIRYPVIGYEDSVNSITKEDLYNCYNYFYNPSNMFLTVTGNVDPNEVLKIVEKNQSKKKFNTALNIELIQEEEPDEVNNLKEIIEMNVTIPKVSVGYKFNLLDIEKKMNFDNVKAGWYLSILCGLLFGEVSDFSLNLKKDKICANGCYYDCFDVDSHIVMTISNETKNSDELINRIEERLNNLEFEQKYFELRKKCLISSCIYMSDDIGRINRNIVTDIIDKGVVNTNIVEDIRSLNYEEFIKFTKLLDFKNRTIVIVNPK